MALTLRVGTSAAVTMVMTTTPQPFALHAVPSRESATGDTWAGLDAELTRWLRLRTSLRAGRSCGSSSLDSMAMALRRVRVTLQAIGETAVVATAGEQERMVSNLVSRAYRWAIRVARELEVIERLALEPMKEWARFESFAPFALAFFDSALAGPFAAVARTSDVTRLRADIDAVMAPISIAMMSSAWAA